MEMLGVAVGLISIVTSFVLWLVKPDFFTKMLKNEKVTDFIQSKGLTDRFTIAIVDDELDSYPIPYIRSLGYQVKEFESVSFSQAEELSKFDLILLDVKGVVKEDLEEGGAKLIKIIKEYRPLVPIVAVSSGYFHTELNDYFKTCDDNMKKPIDEFKIREVISELKLSFYDERHLANSINNDIEDLHISERKKKIISSVVIDYLDNEIQDNDLKIHLHKVATTKTDSLLCNIFKLKDRLQYA